MREETTEAINKVINELNDDNVQKLRDEADTILADQQRESEED